MSKSLVRVSRVESDCYCRMGFDSDGVAVEMSGSPD